MTELRKMGKKAKEAAEKLACAGNLKDKALLAMAAAIEEKEEEILRANEEDLQAAREGGMKPSLLDRLALNHSRIASMAERNSSFLCSSRSESMQVIWLTARS